MFFNRVVYYISNSVGIFINNKLSILKNMFSSTLCSNYHLLHNLEAQYLFQKPMLSVFTRCFDPRKNKRFCEQSFTSQDEAPHTKYVLIEGGGVVEVGEGVRRGNGGSMEGSGDLGGGVRGAWKLDGSWGGVPESGYGNY